MLRWRNKYTNEMNSKRQEMIHDITVVRVTRDRRRYCWREARCASAIILNNQFALISHFLVSIFRVLALP